MTRADVKQKDMAPFLNISLYAVDSWTRKKAKEPSLDTLVKCSSLMLTTIDWLAGKSGAPMWDDFLIGPMRNAIANYVQTTALSGLSLEERITHLLRYTHEIDKERFSEIPLAAAACVPHGDLARFLGSNEYLKLGDATPGTLAEFWQLSPQWLIKGTGVPVVLNAGQYTPLINASADLGLTAEFVYAHQGLLRELVKSYRERQALISTL